MRISTLGFETAASTQMQTLESEIAKTQTELSTGLQIQNAADNPTGMAQVNQLNIELSASQQYVTNGNSASANLKLEAQSMTDATSVVQSARDLAVESNNAALNSSQRQDIAVQLQQLQQQLLGIANSTDSNGNYLFSGYASGTQPFSATGTSATYNGANGVSQVQISSNQRISGGDTGASVFMNIPAGNGTFTTAAGAANTGSAAIDPGSVTNPAAWVPDTYTITFSSPTQYQVTDSAGNPVTLGTDALGNPITTGTFTNPGTVTFNGVQTTITGTPAAGDTFTVAPAGQSSIFNTISGLISTLNSTTLSSAQIATQVGTAIQQIDNAVTNFGNVQASVGGRINAITSAQTGAQTNQTNLQASVTQLSAVDYTAATTQLSSQELALQAAQQSYASLSKLSLFNYIQ